LGNKISKIGTSIIYKIAEEVTQTALGTGFSRSKTKGTNNCYQSYKTILWSRVSTNNLEKQQKSQREFEEELSR